MDEGTDMDSGSRSSDIKRFSLGRPHGRERNGSAC